MEEKVTMDDLIKKEREKKRKKKKLLYSLAAAGIVFTIGYNKGQSDCMRSIKRELKKNWRQLNLGGGVTMPLYYHKKNEQGIHVVLRSVESSMAKMEEEIKSLKEVAK